MTKMVADRNFEIYDSKKSEIWMISILSNASNKPDIWIIWT